MFDQSQQERAFQAQCSKATAFGGGSLLEAGVNLRIIQLYLGHASPATTAIYTHLTSITEVQTSDKIDEMLAGLWR